MYQRLHKDSYRLIYNIVQRATDKNEDLKHIHRPPCKYL